MRGYSGTLPNSALRFFGFSHGLLGLIIITLGFVQLGITSKDIDEEWDPTPSRFTFYTYIPVAAVIFSALMVGFGFYHEHKERLIEQGNINE